VLWTVANERDEIGSDLVPDYLTSVKEGAFLRLAVQLLRPARGRARQAAAPGPGGQAIAPDYALGAHVAALGLTFAAGDRAAGRRSPTAFIGEHGSWNRKPLSGYKVVFVPFADGKPSGRRSTC
jgi:glucose/arabinose dehydrogenase